MRWVSAGFLRVGGVYGLQRRRKGDKNLMSPPGSPWLTSRFGSSLMDLLATPRSCGFVAARRSSTRRLGRSRIAARQLPGPNTAKLSWRILPRSRAFNTVRPRSPSSSAGASIRLKPSRNGSGANRLIWSCWHSGRSPHKNLSLQKRRAGTALRLSVRARRRRGSFHSRIMSAAGALRAPAGRPCDRTQQSADRL